VATKHFVKPPISNLSKSLELFTKLGFKFNPQFTDETATCMIVAEDIFVMLLTEAKVPEFYSQRNLRRNEKHRSASVLIF